MTEQGSSVRERLAAEQAEADAQAAEGQRVEHVTETETTETVVTEPADQAEQPAATEDEVDGGEA